MRLHDSGPRQVSPHPRKSGRTPAVRTLLLVDDEDQIRRLIARTLEAEGYLVLQASDGSSAWDMWRARSAEICLVISDIRMSGLDGRELAERIRSQPQPPPVLFISGYGQEGLWLPGPLLPKPFQLEALSAEVRRLIAASERGMMAS